jgi:hypothetical protein
MLADAGSVMSMLAGTGRALPMLAGAGCLLHMAIRIGKHLLISVSVQTSNKWQRLLVPLSTSIGVPVWVQSGQMPTHIQKLKQEHLRNSTVRSMHRMMDRRVLGSPAQNSMLKMRLGQCSM